MKLNKRVFIPLLMGIAVGTAVFLVRPLFIQQNEAFSENKMGKNRSENTERATFGGGCFWCVEAVYERLDGVISVVSGYAGGSKEDPTYEEVSRGTTGHAEVVQIEYDPGEISYKELLDMFWDAHDPTTLNRQGADVGTQYRSIILYHDEDQKRQAEQSKARASKDFSKAIVTEIVPLEAFYTAEEYHQDFFDKNPYYGYCRIVIAPKLKKLGLDTR